ncbi:hypothetical protein [Halorussus salinus]|uniref:hypothetical protein n=1 Tax=Halorussus salinus TaxID=1364935 RepID=UPI001EE3A914|nr:hypothetical protein [Halorussus salinus]
MTVPASNPRTAIDYSFEDHADNEDGVRVERQRQYDDGWGPWQIVETLPANAGTGTVTGTDDTVSPGNTYRYRFTAFTEDATNTSVATASVTTESSGESRTRRNAAGWTVEIEHSSGRVLRPRLLDDPEFTPALQSKPECRIPVPRDEKWQASGFEDARVSVWKDGKIRPIETLDDVELKPGRTVLVASGGRQLDDRVTAEFDDEAAHLAAKQLGQNNTSYQMNVDDPASTVQSDTVMQSGDTESELRDELASAIEPADPIAVADGQLSLLQSCFVAEGESPTDEFDPDYATSRDVLSGGSGRGVGSDGAWLEWEFTPEYRIPASDVAVAARLDAQTSLQGFSLSVNGDEVASHVGGGTVDVEWMQFPDVFNGDGYTGADLPAGEPVTVRLEGVGSTGVTTIFDVVALYDTGGRYGSEFSFTFDNDNGGDAGYLAGPEETPDEFEVAFETVGTAFNVVGAEIMVTMAQTEGAHRLELSNDDGVTWQSATDTASFETAFGSAGASIQWRLTLSRYGSRSDATPTQGYKGQALDGFELRADLEDTPVLDAFGVDGSLIEAWTSIAGYGRMIWSLERDQDGWRVEWTQPGQRQADIDASLIDYTVTKSTSNRYEKAVIKGGNQPVRGEEWTAQAGEWVGLAESELVAGTQIVRDPATGSSGFEQGADYALDRTQGRIKALSGGSLADGAAYEIDYEFKPVGEYTAADAGESPRTVVRTRPELASVRACQQAALYLIQRVQEPQWSARVVVPHVADISLVDALSWAELPADKRLEVQEIEQTPRETVLHLGNWESPGRVLDDFAQRISANSSRV